MTAVPAPPTAKSPPHRRKEHRPHAHRRARWVRCLTVVLVAGLILGLLIDGEGWISAFTAVRQASSAWVGLALAAGIASMACFGAMRRSALRAAGVPVGAGDAIATSFAAGALHTTMPGGAVFATAYTFRRMRGWGASTPVAGWCLAVTGVLASVTLTLMTVAAVLLGGGATSIVRLTVALVPAAAATALLVLVARRPKMLLIPAGIGLRWLNRARSRPAEAGQAGLAAAVGDLGIIRATPRQWLASAGWSVANWVLDGVCLWAAAMAVGVHVPIAVLILSYTAGMVALSASPLPAGVGVVETVLALGLTAGGAPAAAAVAAVLVYRLVAVGGVAGIGWPVLGARRARRRRSSWPSEPGLLTPPGRRR